MSTVEPIRKIEDLKKIEKILSKNKRDLLLFLITILSQMLSKVKSIDIVES